MIRQGKLCRHCTVKQCKDKGTAAEPIEIECPTCNGQGCEHCNEGYIRIDGCPNQQCGDIAFVVKLADLFDKGMPPVQGGALDQSAWFLDAVAILRNDEAAVKAEEYGD